MLWEYVANTLTVNIFYGKGAKAWLQGCSVTQLEKEWKIANWNNYKDIRIVLLLPLPANIMVINMQKGTDDKLQVK